MATKSKQTKAARVPVRHGDIILTPIARATVKGLKRIAGNSLATGTATGHSHRVTPAANVRMYTLDGGDMLLRVVKPAKVAHEEHADIKLAAGDWRVSHKRQYDRDNGWINVSD